MVLSCENTFNLKSHGLQNKTTLVTPRVASDVTHPLENKHKNSKNPAEWKRL